MHWAEGYIGLPWSPTGEGPDTFHCWSFFRAAQAAGYGRDVPRIVYPEGKSEAVRCLAIARHFKRHPERQRWMEIPWAERRDGDAVLMRQARYPVHIGIWLDVDRGGILHCSRDAGVVFQSLSDVRASGWSIYETHRFRG